jgi:hypothetical protein
VRQKRAHIAEVKAIRLGVEQFKLSVVKAHDRGHQAQT